MASMLFGDNVTSPRSLVCHDQMDRRPDQRPVGPHLHRHRGQQRTRVRDRPRARAPRGSVILAARNEAKGLDAVARIKAEQPRATVEYRALDLADLASLRAFAASIVGGGIAVDVLINNAGVMFPPRQLTPQGFESQFATNHLGHFALSGLLYDTIRRGRDARVVTVTSNLHRGGFVHFDHLSGA